MEYAVWSADRDLLFYPERSPLFRSRHDISARTGKLLGTGTRSGRAFSEREGAISLCAASKVTLTLLEHAIPGRAVDELIPFPRSVVVPVAGLQALRVFIVAFLATQLHGGVRVVASNDDREVESGDQRYNYRSKCYFRPHNLID